ncbi:hypothetical protein V1478_005974 [Vespula squamosa]|uniref:Uncharacterized protein n=1 Tax=Vespula squamosa TaxID=30214 RepID=A0ABD2B8X1_VESSQ
MSKEVVKQETDLPEYKGSVSISVDIPISNVSTFFQPSECVGCIGHRITLSIYKVQKYVSFREFMLVNAYSSKLIRVECLTDMDEVAGHDSNYSNYFHCMSIFGNEKSLQFFVKSTITYQLSLRMIRYRKIMDKKSDEKKKKKNERGNIRALKLVLSKEKFTTTRRGTLGIIVKYEDRRRACISNAAENADCRCQNAQRYTNRELSPDSHCSSQLRTIYVCANRPEAPFVWITTASSDFRKYDTSPLKRMLKGSERKRKRKRKRKRNRRDVRGWYAKIEPSEREISSGPLVEPNLSRRALNAVEHPIKHGTHHSTYNIFKIYQEVTSQDRICVNSIVTVVEYYYLFRKNSIKYTKLDVVGSLSLIR